MVLNVFPIEIKKEDNKISIIVKYYGKIIGSCILLKSKSNIWIINKINIIKDFRNYKLGTKLIHSSLFITKYKLTYELNLTSNNELISFLLKIGFIKKGKKLIPDLNKIEYIMPLINFKKEEFNKIRFDLTPILCDYYLANNKSYNSSLSLNTYKTLIANKLKLRVTTNPGKHNWKKIHELIVKDTPLSSLGGFEKNNIDITNFYIFDLLTNKPIGYFTLGFTSEYHRFFGLEFMGVLPKYRCKGVGSKIIKFAKKYANKQGYKRLFSVHIKSEDHIRRLNEKAGFIYENTYVNVTLEDGTRFDFCPIAYYNRCIKNKYNIKKEVVFDIMYCYV